MKLLVFIFLQFCAFHPDYSQVKPVGNFFIQNYYSSGIGFLENDQFVIGDLGESLQFFDEKGVFQKKVFHPGMVNDLTVSPDKKNLLTSSADSWIYLWDANGDRLRSFQPIKKEISKIVFLPDGSGFAAGTGEGDVIICDWDGKIIHQWKLKGYIRSLSTSIQENYLLVSTVNGLVRVFDWKEGKQIWSISFPGLINYSEFSGDGTKIAISLTKESIIKVWDFPNRSELATLSLPKNKKESYALSLLYAQFTADGKNILGAIDGGFVGIWEIETEKFIQAYKIDFNKEYKPVRPVRFAVSDTGKTLVSSFSLASSSDYIILTARNYKEDQSRSLIDQVRELKKKKYISQISKLKPEPQEIPIQQKTIVSLNCKNPDFSSRGNYFHCRKDQKIFIYNDKGNLINTIPESDKLVLVYIDDSDGEVIILTSSGYLKILDIEGNEKIIQKLEWSPYLASYFPKSKKIVFFNNNSIYFEDDTFRALAENDCLYEYDLRTKLIRPLSYHKDIAHYLTASEDEKSIYSISKDRTFNIWYSDSANFASINYNKKGSPLFIQVSPDDKEMVLGLQKILSFYSVSEKIPIRELSLDSIVYGFAFLSRKNEYLYSQNNRVFWNKENKSILFFEANYPIEEIKISRNKKKILIYGSGNLNLTEMP